MADREPAVDPLWPQGPPSRSNIAIEWLSELASRARLSPDQEFQCFLQSLLCQDLTVEQFLPGRLVCSLLVRPRVANRYRTLHGGVIGALIELLGSTVIKGVAGPKDGSVTDVNISYISASQIEEEVEFEAKVLRLDRNVAVAAVDVRNRKSQKPAAQGRVTMCFTQDSKL